MDIEACESSVSSADTQFSITRQELFLYLQEKRLLASTPSQCRSCLVDYIINKTPEHLQQMVHKHDIQDKIKVFVNNALLRYRQCSRNCKNVLQKHKNWFDESLNINIIPSKERLNEGDLKRKGRPKKLFTEGSKRTKSRQVSELVTKSSPQLLLAAQKSLRQEGKRVASTVIEIASTASPRSLKRMKDSALAPPTATAAYLPEQALALMIDCDLSKDAYINIQQGAKNLGSNIYPSYKAIQVAKQTCYPESDIKITEDCVEVSLQRLLDFTLERLLDVYGEVFSRVETQSVKVVSKWGFDGSGGHSIYKQQFGDSRLYGDSNIILCSVVPIQIYDVNRALWKASSTSSTRFCRPLIFRILKETEENVKNMFDDVQRQINNLESKIVEINGKLVSFEYVMLPTMFDGKIINILTRNRSTQSCYICKAKASDMNKIDILKKRVCDTSAYKYGISILHAYIRSMDLLLHVCYKLTLKKWQARGDVEKNIVKKRQKQITTKFYEDMGLVIDLPKQGGGSSNDGNTARRFFSSPEHVGEITGLDSNLISRFSIILSTLASGYDIKIYEFRKYCLDTAKMYSDAYNWYNMSVTVHKVLLHGADIVQSLPLPIGTLSEDIQESRQKDFKNYRLFHTRKTSRLNTNTDIFHMLLVTSDPVITSLRKKPKKKSVPFSKDITIFFSSPDIPTDQDIILDEDENDDEDGDDLINQ